jgi:hypothetical protein
MHLRHIQGHPTSAPRRARAVRPDRWRPIAPHPRGTPDEIAEVFDTHSAETTIPRRCPTALFERRRDHRLQDGGALEDFQSFFAALDYKVEMLGEISPGRQADYIARPR